MFTIPQIPTLSPLFQPALWCAVLVVWGIAYGLGRLLLWRIDGIAWRESRLLRTLIGFCLLPTAMLVIGQIPGLLFKIPWLLLGAVGAGAYLTEAIRVHQGEIPAAFAENTFERWVLRGGWVMLGLYFVLILMPLVAPPLNYDVLEYHLGFVAEIFSLGQVRPVPHLFYTAQPLGTELLYLLAALGEGTAQGSGPGLFQWTWLLFGLVLLRGVLAELGLRRCWQPWVLLFWFLHPVLLKFQLDCKTDWSGVVWLAGALWVFLLYRPRGNRWQGVAILGLLIAAAMVTKWTHAGTVAIPAACLGCWLVAEPVQGQQRVINIIRAMLAMIALAGIIWLPWPVWLWRVAGNPIAPFGASLFPTASWTPAQQHFLMATHGPLSPLGAEYWANLLSRLCVGLGGIPWVALAIVSALATFALRFGRPEQWDTVACKRTNLALGFMLMMLPGILLWGQLRHAADRFMAPVYALSLVIVSAAGVAGFRVLKRRLGKAGAVRLAIAIWFVGAMMVGWELYQRTAQLTTLPFADYTLGRMEASPYIYWKQTLGVTGEMFEAAAALPEDSHLLAVNEARRYAFVHTVTLSSVFDVNPLRDVLRMAPDAPAVLEALQQAGYTHLLYNEFEMVRILKMHPPLDLQDDRAFQARQEDDRLLLRYDWGRTEFSVDPLTSEEQALYGEFLKLLQSRVVWRSGSPYYGPSAWIAKLSN